MNRLKNHSLRFYSKNLITALIFFMSISVINSQNKVNTNIPNFDDSYDKSVTAIKAGVLNIDYKKFRENFVKSGQYKTAYKSRATMSNLTRELFENRFHSRHDSIIVVSKKILDLDYTNVAIHKVLEDTYTVLNDPINAKKHSVIRNGLLKSITDNGDGKSYDTAWSIVNVSEQYFILDALNCTVVNQELIKDNGTYYETTVMEKGIRKTYFFNATMLEQADKNIRTF